MDFDTFCSRLQKARYFEGYPDAAKVKAIRALRKSHAAGMAGSHKAEFERFPGLALVVIDVDQELIGYDDLKGELRRFGKASFGIFAPRSVQIRRNAGEALYRLQFTVNGTKYVWSLEDDSWIPNAFFEELDRVTRAECSGLEFHAVAYPDSGQSGFYLWCTPRAYKAISRAGMIPSSKRPLDPLAAAEDSGNLAKSPPVPEADKTPEFAPPADVARAERLGVFRKGKWQIPLLSKKILSDRQEITAASTSANVGSALLKQIHPVFNLLCACHCGLTDIGDPTAYANKVIALVDDYLFGTWRVGYVERGVTFDEATARKELNWSAELQEGCAAAISLGDYESLRKFLEYTRYDIYDEHLADELAYYRLLSDVLTGRNEWDWAEQASHIEDAFDEHYRKLLPCLKALKDDDAASFQKLICKFASKPKHVFAFSAFVDCDVTVLAGLALQKGWTWDRYPVPLQDKILDRFLFFRTGRHHLARQQ